jgi:hypothetical protein
MSDAGTVYNTQEDDSAHAVKEADMKLAPVVVTVALLLGSGYLTSAMAASPAAKDEQLNVVTGTLQELDVAKKSGTIKTDVGTIVGFTMKSPDLFKGLSVGERVSVRLDEKGQVIKVMETTIPELPGPGGEAPRDR